MQENKRLERKITDRVFAGVCSGLGEHYNLDVNLVRVLFFISIFFFSFGFWIYIALWIFLPEESYGGFDNKSFYNQHKNKDTMDNMENQNDKKFSMPPKKNNGNIVGGVILIVIGALFLISNLIPHISFGYIISKWWPVILIVIGGSILLKHVNKKY
ncbi:MAG: PspC domain-containing protein [Hyphomicrobiales bacterium]